MKDKLIKFLEQDTDTILYQIMCFVTIPLLLICIVYVGSVCDGAEEVRVCAFQSRTGLYCPGCGGTRAFQALFRLDILQAVFYHPPLVYGVGLYAAFFISQTLMRVSKGKIPGMKMRPGYLYALPVVFFMNFIIRNVLLMVFHLDTLPMVFPM